MKKNTICARMHYSKKTSELNQKLIWDNSSVLSQKYAFIGINDAVIIHRATKGQPYISCALLFFSLDKALSHFNFIPISIILAEIL